MKEEKYIDFEDFRIFTKRITIADNKDKPVLILLHDSWGCTEMWEDFPEKSAIISGLNTLVYDRRGYGKSSPFAKEERTKYYLHEEADFLIRLMDKMQIPTAILYGHSDGGTISLIAAANYPERVAGIVVEAAHSFMEEKGIAAVRESRDKAKHNSLLVSLAKFHGGNTQELFRRWHETWLSPSFADWTIVPLLKKITCPVLAFRGEQDPYDTVAQLDILKKEITGKTTAVVISNASHTPRKENEAETTMYLKRFFKQPVSADND